MRRKIKPVPAFRSEAEERRFWETRDSSSYVDWSKAKRARFPNLTTSISLRLSRRVEREQKGSQGQCYAAWLVRRARVASS
jgi:hypothetical protein